MFSGAMNLMKVLNKWRTVIHESKRLTSY